MNSQSSRNLTQLKVVGMTGTIGSRTGFAMVLQEYESSRRLQIIIGSAEAQSIECALRGIKPPRPLPHDLLSSVMDIYDIPMHGVVIDRREDGVFTATIMLGPDPESGKINTIDARSSDAVALALRLNAPIYIDRDLLSRIGVSTEAVSSSPEISAGEVLSQIKGKRNGIPLSEQTEEQLRQALEEAIRTEKYEDASLIKSELDRRAGKQPSTEGKPASEE